MPLFITYASYSHSGVKGIVVQVRGGCGKRRCLSLNFAVSKAGSILQGDEFVSLAAALLIITFGLVS